MPKRYERREKVAEAIKRELANIIESGGIKDDRMADFVSIVDVDLSPNLSNARVSYSIMGSEEPGVEIGTQAALEANKGKLRGVIARKLNLRYAPDLNFVGSDALKKGSDLIDLINQVNNDDSEVQQ